ncbi:unnamed protein product [Ilex paraguariensis]|uniref:Uncharacterized protein n=1 Tax=Ilex paraguariensis TaxID=185542 RepID=A0ABC8R502_9AQUA
MIRTRLAWFTLGFATAGATITHLVLKDLWVHRNSLSSDLKLKFDALDTRITNLEPVLSNNSIIQQEEGNLK